MEALIRAGTPADQRDLLLFMIAATWPDYSGPIGPGLGPFTLTDDYKNQAHKIANERVELAGERLAIMN